MDILGTLEKGGSVRNIPFEDTKAAALAGAGRYDDAIALEEQLLAKQIASGQQENVAVTKRRIERFRSRQPWIEE